MAMRIKEACLKKGYRFLTYSSTNQQFPIMPNNKLNKLKENFEYSHWLKIDNEYSAVRFCTSWATGSNDVDQLISEIENG
jgi:threonine aldolase